MGGGKASEHRTLNHSTGERIPVSQASADGHREKSISPSSDDEYSGAFGHEEAPIPVQVPTVAETHVVSLGTGLKRPLELGPNGTPMIQKRRRVGLPLRRSSLRARDPQEEGLSEDQALSLAFSGQVDCSQAADWHGISSHEEGSNGEEESASAVSISPTDTDIESVVDVEESKDSILDPNSSEGRKSRSEAFKAWVGDKPGDRDEESIMPTFLNPSKDIVSQEAELPRHGDTEDPLPAELQVTGAGSNRKVFNIHVKRSPEHQETRLNLPVVAEEQKIMEAIHNNSIVIIWGATGSGKTTQVPQFPYESGYGSPGSPTPGMIGITQPRRVAAVSSANRVSEELGSASDKVSYQIRFDSTVSGRTAIKYMTDGILVREITEDVALSEYSALVIDEAHERSINTDILIGMLTRIVALRNAYVHPDGAIRPLKLIIMSATVRVSDFLSNKLLFRDGSPPLVQAEGRQFPVTVHFARRTERDYVEEIFTKVCKGHKKLPPGGMLVFLTGQSEINALALRLGEALSRPTSISGTRLDHSTLAAIPPDIDYIEVDGDDFRERDVDEEDVSDAGDANELVIEDKTDASKNVRILPLYSQLPTKAQLRVFETPLENTRLIVLATNVAETSLTIPGIRYVFDCGRAKEKKYDPNTGVQTLEVDWISKASANQRAGRAGRTGPGHVYRLYSSAVYERDFQEHAVPEILRTPIEGVVLQLKSMKLQNIASFPFPTPPDLGNLMKAEKLLTHLGSLTVEGNITLHGQELAQYPLSPRYAKMLSIGHQADCIYLTIATVAALAIRDIFTPENQPILAPGGTPQTPSSHIPGYRFTSQSPTADFLKYLSTFAAYSWHIQSPYASASTSGIESFCTSLGLRTKPLKEVSQLYHQLLNVVSRIRPSLISKDSSSRAIHNTKIRVPSKKQISALKQIVAAGFIDQIAIRADLAPAPPEISRKPRRAIDVPYFTLFPSHEGRANTLEEKAVFIHPSSILAARPVDELPPYIVYSHLQRSAPSYIEGDKVKKVRMHPLTDVKAGWISHLARGTPLLQYGKPVIKVEGNRKVAYAVPMLAGEKGSTGWPLPAEAVKGKGKGKGA